MSARRLSRGRCSRRLQPLALAFPHETDVAPQLVVVALAHAALEALDRALETAHPGLDAATQWTSNLELAAVAHRLSPPERRALSVVRAAVRLAARLDDYDAAVVRHNAARDDAFPF